MRETESEVMPQSPLSSPARARDASPLEKALAYAQTADIVVPLTETDRRVAHILDLMEANEYVPGKTGPELSALWGISVNAVEHLSAQAARILRLARTPDVVVARISRKLDDWLEWAAIAPDRVQLAKLRLEIIGAMGARAERRAEMAGAAAPDLETLLASPPPELAALLELCLLERRPAWFVEMCGRRGWRKEGNE